MSEEQTVEDFKAGDLVTYVPYHAYGDLHHPDCETGVVTSVNTAYVFARFKGRAHAEGCKPDQLVKQ